VADDDVLGTLVLDRLHEELQGLLVVADRRAHEGDLESGEVVPNDEHLLDLGRRSCRAEPLDGQTA
jgi:hypothetical protein